MRSSVLMGPPVIRVGGSPRPVPDWSGNEQWLPLVPSGSQSSRVSPLGKLGVHACLSTAVSLGPDPTTCGAGRSMRVGDGWCSTPLGGICATGKHLVSLIGQHGRLADHSADGPIQPCAATRPGPTSRHPAASRVRSSPSTTYDAGPARSTSRASAPSCIAAVAAVAAVTGTGRAWGSHAGHGLDGGEGQQAGAAVGRTDQHGGHVGGLVVRQPPLVDLDLAEDRDHRDQEPGVLQHHQHGPGRRPWPGGRPAPGGRGTSARAVSSAKPGSGIVRTRRRGRCPLVHGAILPDPWCPVGVWGRGRDNVGRTDRSSHRGGGDLDVDRLPPAGGRQRPARAGLHPAPGGGVADRHAGDGGRDRRVGHRLGHRAGLRPAHLGGHRPGRAGRGPVGGQRVHP